MIPSKNQQPMKPNSKQLLFLFTTAIKYTIKDIPNPSVKNYSHEMPVRTLVYVTQLFSFINSFQYKALSDSNITKTSCSANL